MEGIVKALPKVISIFQSIPLYECMRNVRRYYQPGQTYFFTHVTHFRAPILVDNIDLFHQSLDKLRERPEVVVLAYVVIPDHVHVLMTIESGRVDLMMKGLKTSFAQKYRWRHNFAGRVWQHRFWDHIIRDQEDFNQHIDYIHFNAVKHGLTVSASNYEYSSFREWVQMGCYELDWRLDWEVGEDEHFGE